MNDPPFVRLIKGEITSAEFVCGLRSEVLAQRVGKGYVFETRALAAWEHGRMADEVDPRLERAGLMVDREWFKRALERIAALDAGEASEIAREALKPPLLEDQDG